MEKRKKIEFRNLFLSFVIFICLVLLVLQNFNTLSNVMSGKATYAFAPSNVSVSKYISISFSENLSEGISFGSVNVLPSVNVNATHNYDSSSSGTSYYISVSEDGNSLVDFCIKANSSLTSEDLDVIGLGNETYANSTTTDSLVPEVENEISLTTDYVKSGNEISSGSNNYYRFWLDVPASQPSGDYNNTLSFKGVQSGLEC